MLARATLNASRSSCSDTPLQRIPTPPEPKREHGFFEACEGIRGRPEGDACPCYSESIIFDTLDSGAAGGSARLPKWRPSHALEASDAALTRPWRGPRVGVGRWCGARFRPQPLQNLGGSIVFSRPSKGSAVALRGTHARARDVKRFTFLVL